MANSSAASVPSTSSEGAATSRQDRAPALASLCAVTALGALVVGHVLIPGFAPNGDPNTWVEVGRWGQFLTLASAISACAALPMALALWGRSRTPTAWSKRLSGAGFALILLFVVVRAAFLDRTQTTGQHVFLALGAAHLLGLSVTSLVLFRTSHPLMRAALSGAFVMSLAAVVGHVLELFMRVDMSLTQLQLSRAAHSIGEVGYLITLLCQTTMLFSHSGDRRKLPVRFLGMCLLGMIGTAFFLLSRQLGPEAFGLVLYHAQHVRLLLEASPLLYALPICLALASGISGMLLHRPELHQLALATVLLTASGYSPRTPVQLIWFALALTLMARSARSAAYADADQVLVPAKE